MANRNIADEVERKTRGLGDDGAHLLQSRKSFYPEDSMLTLLLFTIDEYFWFHDSQLD